MDIKKQYLGSKKVKYGLMLVCILVLANFSVGLIWPDYPDGVIAIVFALLMNAVFNAFLLYGVKEETAFSLTPKDRSRLKIEAIISACCGIAFFCMYLLR